MAKCFFLLVMCIALDTSTASLLYGQPCSERNTAYIYPSSWFVPEETNCVDITGLNGTAFSDTNITGFLRRVSYADTLYADHIALVKFPTKIIRELPRLEMLDLSGNHIKWLPYKMFRIMPRVTKMLLADNEVFVPRRRALFKSATVNILMLSGNGIRAIYPATFSKMPNLRILYLEANRLTQVTPEMFAGLSELAFLHLGGNMLTKVPSQELMPASLRFYITDLQNKP